MTSQKKIAANRRNGARSRGPKTPEGKSRSRYNAIRHGLCAECTVLENESLEGFHELLNHHVRRFAPLDDVEFGMVEEMASAYWRLRRSFAIEKELLEKAIEHQEGSSEAARVAQAWQEIADSPALVNLYRHQASLHRMHQRALNNLLMLRSVEPLQSDLQNEPTEVEPPSPPADREESAAVPEIAPVSPAAPVQNPPDTRRLVPPDYPILMQNNKFARLDSIGPEVPRHNRPHLRSETGPDQQQRPKR
jgi:hypothetical protein